MTRAEAASKIEELNDALKHAEGDARAAKAALREMGPALVELHGGLTKAAALTHALLVYQGGTAGSPPNDLARMLAQELEGLRALAAANVPRRLGALPANTGLLDDFGEEATVELVNPGEDMAQIMRRAVPTDEEE